MSQVAFDFHLDDGGEPTYSVSELGDLINGVLRRRFVDGVWVRGEIQGWSERGPHAYFRLVEEFERPDGSIGKATVNVQFFANVRMRLRPMLQKNRLRLADGLKVRIFGHLDFFAPSGTLGLKMSGIDPRFTLGDLAMQRDEVVRRLVAAGLYEANRSRPLASAPLRVGVVTSTSGAAWADFVHELERSGLGFQVRVIDVRVQGDQAVDMVTRAIRTLGRHRDLDVVAVVRGGGARSELATFDHEAIATAIATCPLPVLTGLGHEIDRSVADEVAHASLKTPTACAAALVERVAEFRGRSELAWDAVRRVADRQLTRSGGRLNDVAHGVRHRVVAAVERADGRLQQRAARLGSSGVQVLDGADHRLDGAAEAIRRAPGRVDNEARHLDALAARVRLLDPVHTMARGWSITRTADGRVVRHAGDLSAGDEVVTTFADGAARSVVQDVRRE
ncbi:MAG: exodeoxyribonuclease VII large subunit [Ilumatobacteraceae bacterium]